MLTMHACRSWQAYVDEHLLVPLPNGGELSSAAIVGADGGVWAQSPTFPAISADEVCPRHLASPLSLTRPSRICLQTSMRDCKARVTAALVAALAVSALRSQP